ncbi:hypothetical protein J4438_00280 [Candidatus Woesearchaeota archaeon]|nr:hypothetical protein [Candidatus Woesearchaeota archaeon]
MLNSKSRTIMLISLIILLFIGVSTIDTLNPYTGNTIKPINEKAPLVSVLVDKETAKSTQDVLDLILKNDEKTIELKPINQDNNYLLLKWNKELKKISFYMIKSDNQEANFEIYSTDKTKIASGKLTESYKWYEFDVSPNGLSKENYILINNGPSNIIINQIVGLERPESFSNRLINILIEGFI